MTFLGFSNESKCCRRNGKQCRPWSDCWSGSALFAQAYLSENLGSLRYTTDVYQLGCQCKCWCASSQLDWLPSSNFITFFFLYKVLVTEAQYTNVSVAEREVTYQDLIKWQSRLRGIWQSSYMKHTTGASLLVHTKLKLINLVVSLCRVKGFLMYFFIGIL